MMRCGSIGRHSQLGKCFNDIPIAFSFLLNMKTRRFLSLFNLSLSNMLIVKKLKTSYLFNYIHACCMRNPFSGVDTALNKDDLFICITFGDLSKIVSIYSFRGSSEKFCIFFIKVYIFCICKVRAFVYVFTIKANTNLINPGKEVRLKEGGGGVPS